MSTWDVIYGLLALGTYHQVSSGVIWLISTPHSYIRRFHGGYVAVTRPENFPGALRAPDNGFLTNQPHRCRLALSRTPPGR